MAVARWLRSRTVLGILATLWIALLLGARFGGWDAAQTAVTVLLLILGVMTAIVFLHRWGDTQDAVVDRDVARARMAKEVDKILEEEEKSVSPESVPPPENRTPQ